VKIAGPFVEERLESREYNGSVGPYELLAVQRQMLIAIRMTISPGSSQALLTMNAMLEISLVALF
jgi:hypothetical protein